MRNVIIGAAIAIAAVSAVPTGAIAQPRPWCFRGGEHSPGGGLLVCTYHTLQQCQATVSGGSEHCVENPELAWDRLEGKRTKQPRPARERPR